MKVMVVSSKYLSVTKLMNRFIAILSLVPNISFKNADNLNEISTITMAEAKPMAMSFNAMGFGVNGNLNLTPLGPNSAI